MNGAPSHLRSVYWLRSSRLTHTASTSGTTTMRASRIVVGASSQNGRFSGPPRFRRFFAGGSTVTGRVERSAPATSVRRLLGLALLIERGLDLRADLAESRGERRATVGTMSQRRQGL